MPERNRSFAVIGLGAMGRTIAKSLTRFGDYVVGVDRDDTVVNQLADDISEAVILDARNQDALRDAGIGDCDVAVIAIGNDLESNMMAAINARLIGVETIWAKASSRNHHRILSKIGVDRVINPEEEQGRALAEMLHNPQLQDFMSLGNGFHVVVFRCAEALAGKTLKTLNLQQRFSVRCLGIMRQSEFLGDGATFDPDASLETDDRLLLLGRRDDLRRMAAAL